jgi:hypothetical protein
MPNHKQETHTSPEGISITFWRYNSYAVRLMNTALSNELRKITDVEDSLTMTGHAMAYITNIEFNLTEDAPDWARDFQEWWENHGKAGYQKKNLKGFWESFIELEFAFIDPLIVDGWGNTRRNVLMAEEEMQPGSQDVEDEDFLADATPA